MRLSRRRFVSVLATAALAGSSRGDSAVSTSPVTAQGRFYALGTEAHITLVGERKQAQTALLACRKEINAIERAFSLYDPHSMLSQLNRNGYLITNERFSTLLQHALTMAKDTNGAFDPTIQPLWRAYAQGGNTEHARRYIGWRKLLLDKGAARFTQPNMAASFNGIAQGFAADQVLHKLRDHGFHHTLINLGEFVASGTKADKPWRLGIHNPITDAIATDITPVNAAVATSEPYGTSLAGEPHILDPLQRTGERWASVTVEAKNAWQADALSTAIAASPMHEAESLLAGCKATRAWLINSAGVLRHWQA